MKKGAIKTSGILTLIFYLILLVLGAVAVCSVLNVEAVTKIISSNEIIAKIFTVVSTIFISFPALLVGKVASSLDADLLNKIFSILLTVFSAYMIFWGIKEITLAKKDDEHFARCKKTCAFMMFIKFMVMLYFIATIVCTFVIDEFKFIAELLETLFDIPYMFAIVSGVFALISFIIWLLPVINIAKVAKAVANGNYNQNPNMQNDPNMQYAPNGQPYDPNMQYNGQPTMQANMPPMPGYQPQYQQQSVQAQFNPQVQQEEQERASQIIPGQNGVPENITPKGIADLERLERLRQSGAITEENYQVMWQKICSTNLS